MGTSNISKDELFYAIRGLNLSEFTIKDMDYLLDLFKIKSRQIEEEIRKRKLNGKD